jgi:hypothetical protein
MPKLTIPSAYLKLICLFVLVRLLINLFALQHYGFHRDELLHYALGDHLAWGFKEVPPFIALLAKLQAIMFGSSLFATRIFTTLASGCIVLLTGLLTFELGGKKYAITLACLTLTFSPCFLASGYLFHPVVFDQMWWVFSAYLLVKYFNEKNFKYLYYLGAVIGFGLLTKYTMAFFTLALVLGVLVTRQRDIFIKKGIWVAVCIAILIFLPNVIWQLSHHLPLITHMGKLRSTMLDYIKPTDFLIQQLLVNGSGVWVWLAGIGCLLFSKRLVNYRFLAFAYLFTLLLFLVLHGKIYYLFGAYPMLFAAGGVAFENWIAARRMVLRVAFLIFVVGQNLFFVPLSIPVIPIRQALPTFAFMSHSLKLEFPFKWEDQKLHSMTQDYADMFGWDELGLKVSEAYHSLTPEQQKETIIIANNYGDAGAIHYYGKQYGLPDVVCLNSSFALWAPDRIKAKYIIYLDDYDGNKNILKLYRLGLIGAYKKTGEVNNPLAREQGDWIYILSDLKPGLDQLYQKELAQTRVE